MKTTLTLCRTIFLFVLTFLLGACSGDFLIEDSRIAGLSDTRTESEVWDGTVAAAFAGGSGTAEAPYQIANGAQLAYFASMVNSGQTSINGKLTADILLNDISNWESWNESTKGLNSWTPIGSITYRFSGTLDGDGHSVSGIYINSTADYQGLVGYLGAGTLQNLGVKASYIKGGNRVGGVCGMNSGLVTNCYNTGNVTGNSQVGGVCGYKQGTVSNCYNTGSVTGNSTVGGVCGDNQSSTVSNCYNTGSVTGTGSTVGGLCGWNYDGTVTNCYNAGSVTGTERVGGVCGQNYSGSVTNCYNAGKVTGNNKVGGVCGGNYDDTVTNCYYLTGTAAGGINGSDAAGQAEAKTKTEFQSGEVAYLLSTGKNGEIWGQNISFDPKDSYPVLGGLKVVQSGEGSYTNELSNKDGDFYLISTADELRLFASMVNGGQTSIRAKLTADIELNNTTGWENWGSNPPANSWTPIGNYANQFTGTLDGDGHSVSGIYINNSEANEQGLVGCLGSGGALQNLGVKSSYIKGGSYVGGLCGVNGGGTVTNCYNTGKVTGSYTIGGLCGMNMGSLYNCCNTGSVTGTAGVGGVCGGNYNTVTNCYYLDTCGAAGEGTSKTAEQFQSGEVAWLLGEGWGQTIGTDSYPVLDADGTKRVYAVTLYQGSDTADARYLNSNGTFPTLTGNAIALVDVDSPFKTGTNIVVKDGDNNYTCAELVLTDGADFYTPVAFTATNATYTRTPSVWATNGGSGSGWETICLPFSGTLYAGGDAKQPVDVASNNGAYWLRSLTGFTEPNTLIFASPATAADSQIKAGVPYIIALPGETFGGESLEGQIISVRGTNVTVTNTAQSVAAGSMFAFTGTFATKACDALSYRLNSENGTSGAGDLFVLDTKKLAPFRCRVDVKGLNIGGRSRSDGNLPTQLRIGQ